MTRIALAIFFGLVAVAMAIGDGLDGIATSIERAGCYSVGGELVGIWCRK